MAPLVSGHFRPCCLWCLHWKQCMWSMWGKWPGCLWCLHWEQCLWSMWGSDLAACGVYTEKHGLWSVWNSDLAALGSYLFGWHESFTLNPVFYFQPFVPKLFVQHYLFFPYKKLRVMNVFSPTFFLGLHTREALSFKCAFNHLVYNIPSNQNRFVICEPCAKTRYLASLRK